ncbi:MAG: cell division control protein Cdc6 [Thermoprotei archaeon]|nr:MAG: cell division control protein Cdc6 [Thermoprotei archaeon]RLF18579.1 MAG: cell division control protein Cdc6 [Thermoprotei archaeon]
MSTALEDIFQRVLTARVFKDREKLRPDYVPEELPHREYEIKRLGETLAPAIKGVRPSNVFIYGLPGTGKTAVAKYVLKKLSKAAARLDLGSGLANCYINCKYDNTSYRVFASLCEQLGVKVPFTGLSIPELFRRFMKALESSSRLVIIVLDEIDVLAGHSSSDLLYRLTRINSELSKSRVALVGVTNDLKFTESLDPRVKSALGEEELVFKPYDSDELEDILRQRAKLAFMEGALEEGVIPLCATLAAREHGDARRALDLLRVAGEVAERGGGFKVTEAHVRKAQKELERDRVVEVLRSMPLHGKLTLMAVYLLERKGVKEKTTGEIYSLYKEVCKMLRLDELTQRRVSDLINELDVAGLVTARVVSRGRRGLTKIVKLNINEEILREGLREDDRLSALLQ